MPYAMTETSFREGSSVKVNRLKEGYTWNVQVAAEDGSLEALRTAKEKAVALTRELEEELNPRPKPDLESVPF